MNKWEVDEHKRWNEKVRSQRFCLPLLDKNRNYEGISSNKRKSFLDTVRKPNPIIVLLYIQNSHTKMQAKCGSKKTHAINFAKFCYFVIFARFEVVTSSASNNFFLGHLRPIIHSIQRK